MLCYFKKNKSGNSDYILNLLFYDHWNVCVNCDICWPYDYWSSNASRSTPLSYIFDRFILYLNKDSIHLNCQLRNSNTCRVRTPLNPSVSILLNV